MARLTWVLAVEGLSTMASAISSLDRPCATRATTSRSLLVRVSIPAAATASGGRATNSPIRRRVTTGDSSASPCMTTCSACSRSAGSVSFSRKPLAPARSARKMYSSSPKLVRMTTRTLSSRSSATICLVASMPSTPGIWMSMSAMSGRCSAHNSTACRPSQASATTSMSSSESSRDRMPLRISAWSSASRILITIALVPDGQFGPDLEAAALARPGVELPAERRYPLPHPDQAHPRSRGHRAHAGSVVVDLDGQGAGRVVQVNGGARPAGVAADVVERFLHDPVGRLVDLGRQRPPSAGEGERHGQAGRARPGHQAVQLAEAAAVTVLAAAVVLAAEHAERGAQLPGGVRARFLDGQQRGRDVLAALARQVHGHAGLDLDHGDAVGQGVVQLAGDAQPFLDRPAPGGLVPGPLRFVGALLDLAKVQLPDPERHGHDPGRDEPAGRVEPSPAPIGAHSSSLRACFAGASARRSHFRLLPWW